MAVMVSNTERNEATRLDVTRRATNRPSDRLTNVLMEKNKVTTIRNTYTSTSTSLEKKKKNLSPHTLIALPTPTPHTQ